MTISLKEHYDEYAVVDLGSNSFHMIVARKFDNALQIIYKNKQSIHLASGLNDQDNLSDKAINDAIHCLTLFAERLKNIPVDKIKVIGTYTLRVAKNRYQFLTMAAKVFPYPIEIISGQEEARLIYLGTVSSESAEYNDTKLVIDIGGGSTEIAVGKSNIPVLVESRPMGCVTYTKKYFCEPIIKRSAFEKAKLAAQQQVEKISAHIKNKNIDVAFGSSGTIKAIHHILLDIGVTDGVITHQRLEDLINYIFEFQSAQAINYPSLSEERKQVFVAGLAIFCGIFSAFGLKTLHYSASALREGILYEMIGDFNQHDIRQSTVNSLAKQYTIDETYATQVVETAKHLFIQWQQSTRIDIDPILESLLYWAALLHEIGLSINFSGIQKHSAYILQHCNLPGFNEEQQLLLATLVKFHRKNIKLEQIPSFSLFETKQILPLIQILRLAVLVNNQRQINQNIKQFNLHADIKSPLVMSLSISAKFAQHNRLILLDLEQEQRCWQANKDCSLTFSFSE